MVRSVRGQVARAQHFMALGARAMRQVMVDHARRVQADKRGGGVMMVTLDDSLPDDPGDALDVLALDQALNTLEQIDERAARVVQLHFFGGLAFPEVAELEGLTVRTTPRKRLASRARVPVPTPTRPNERWSMILSAPAPPTAGGFGR